MIRAARIVVIASTLVAAVGEAYLASSYAPQVFWIALAGLAAGIGMGPWLRPRVMAFAMAALYLTPAVLLLTIDSRGYGLDVIWLLPLLGLMLSDRGALEWSLPRSWQGPLITWAVIVAVGWPIVFLREADFALWILPLKRVSNTSIGFGPWEVGQNVAYFALLHCGGILWIDALCRWYRGQRDAFYREVLSGLAMAAAIAAAVSIYQGFIDLGFLNEGFWEYMIRASGTLGDANKLGAVAAFWTVGGIALALRMPRPWSLIVAIAALVLGIAAAWLSGSRTGLAAVAMSVTIAAVESLRLVKLDLKKMGLATLGALVIGAGLVLVLQNASTHTIAQRGTFGYLPFIGDRGIANSADELLWERFGYGPAAIQMIKEHPIDGVGVGMFHALGYDYGAVAGRVIPAPDNAQAWWRHNFAELGLLGSLPLLAWCFVFGRSLFARSSGGDWLAPAMLRGVLVAFFVASLFGLPAQSAALTLTFWVFVFWFSIEAGATEPAEAATGPSPRWLWAAVVLVGVHTGTTVVDAFGDLRPRHRAERFGWYYRYGYHTNEVDGFDREPDPGGNPIARRWTMKDSLAVIPVKGNVLKFVAWIDHPDSDVRPVHTQVWADGHLVYEGDMRRSPIMFDIPATPGKTHMVIETSIDRTFRPSDSGGNRDRRDLGLSIRDWVWE